MTPEDAQDDPTAGHAPGTPPDPTAPAQQPAGDVPPHPDGDGVTGPAEPQEGQLVLDGALTGQVVYGGYSRGQIILDARRLAYPDGAEALEPHVVPQPGPFAFPALPEEVLVLQATVDLDRDGPSTGDKTVLFDRFPLDLTDPEGPKEVLVDLDREVVTTLDGTSLAGERVEVPPSPGRAGPVDPEGGPPVEGDPARAPDPPFQEGDPAHAQGAPFEQGDPSRAPADPSDAPGPPTVPQESLTPPPGPRPMADGAQVYTADAPERTTARSTAALCRDCDVVLITVCSLRKDHVGAYGELRPSPTPTIDRLAGGGWRFDRAYAASNFTLASLTAVLTGRFGSTTGVTHWDKGLTADVPTLPEVMGLYGYRTAAFTMDAYSGFRPDYGLDRGFQYMDISSAPRSTPDGRRRGGELDGGSLAGDGASAMPAAAWLDRQDPSEPLFLMFHSRTAHYPFVISDEGADRDTTGVHQALWDAGHTQRQAGIAMPGDAGGTATEGAVAPNGQDPLKVLVDRVGDPAVQQIRRHYRDAVARADVDVRRLVEAQEQRGRLDKTIWLLVADHGESLNDHGELLHGAAFYDTVINVPMVLAVPGLPPARAELDSLVSHVDVMPTLLELVGARPPVDLDGASMVPLLTGEQAAIRSVALSEGGVTRQQGDLLPGAVISLPWTLLRHEGGCDPSDPHSPRPPPGEPASCLFHLGDDPGQADVVTTLHQDKADELLGMWQGFRAERAGTPLQVTLDPAMLAELQRTGYDFRLEGQ